MADRMYFAYGSNIDEDQMASRAPGARAVGAVGLIGYRFQINDRGFATVVPAPGSTVHGLLWVVGPEQEAALDRYEGVAGNFYVKRKVVVHTGDGFSTEALVYLAADSEPGVPNPGYLERIVYWGRRHGFPGEYLEELESWYGDTG